MAHSFTSSIYCDHFEDILARSLEIDNTPAINEFMNKLFFCFIIWATLLLDRHYTALPSHYCAKESPLLLLKTLLQSSKSPELWFAIFCTTGLLMRDTLSQLCIFIYYVSILNNILNISNFQSCDLQMSAQTVSWCERLRPNYAKTLNKLDFHFSFQTQISTNSPPPRYSSLGRQHKTTKQTN